MSTRPRQICGFAWASAAVLAAVVSSGCTMRHGGQTGDEDAPFDGGPRGTAFEQLARASSQNYAPARSLRELIDGSDTIIVGRAARMERGRSFIASRGQATQTIVLHLSVLDTLKGPAADTVYLEHVVGDADLALTSTLPLERVLVFARRATDDPLTIDGTIEDSGRGLPQGGVLRRLTTPQGFAVETEQGVEQVLEPTDTLLADASFDALIERVQQALASVVPSDGGTDGAVMMSLPDATVMTTDAALDASEQVDAGTPAEVIERTDFIVFSLPINSIRFGVSTYDPARDLCLSVIWYLDNIEETRFCEIDPIQPLKPYVVIQPGVPEGCWDYASDAQVVAQRGCADFGDLSAEADDRFDFEVDVTSELFDGTLRFARP